MFKTGGLMQQISTEKQNMNVLCEDIAHFGSDVFFCISTYHFHAHVTRNRVDFSVLHFTQIYQLL